MKFLVVLLGLIVCAQSYPVINAPIVLKQKDTEILDLDRDEVLVHYKRCKQIKRLSLNPMGMSDAPSAPMTIKLPSWCRVQGASIANDGVVTHVREDDSGNHVVYYQDIPVFSSCNPIVFKKYCHPVLVILHMGTEIEWYDSKFGVSRSFNYRAAYDHFNNDNFITCVDYIDGKTFYGTTDGCVGVLGGAERHRMLSHQRVVSSCVLSLVVKRTDVGGYDVFSSHIDGSVYKTTFSNKGDDMTSIKQWCEANEDCFTTSIVVNRKYLLRTLSSGGVVIGSRFSNKYDSLLPHMKCVSNALMSDEYLVIPTCGGTYAWKLT